MTMVTVGKLLAAMLLAVQLVVAFVALDGGGSSTGAPLPPITPASDPVEALTIETALSLTDPVAREWDENAVLVSALMEVVWDQEAEVVVPSRIADGGAMTLVYAAGDHQLTLVMDRRSGVIFHAEEGTWSAEVAVPLPASAIVRSSAIAVLATEISYGTSYRAACPEHRFVTRVYLSRSSADPGVPTWLVSYVDQRRRDRPDIQVVVDAVTGNTVDGQASSLGCDDL